MVGVGWERWNREHKHFLRPCAVSISSYLMLERQKAKAKHGLHSHLVSTGKCYVLNSFSRWDFPRLN